MSISFPVGSMLAKVLEDHADVLIIPFHRQEICGLGQIVARKNVTSRFRLL